MFYNVSNMNAIKKMFYLEIDEYNSLFGKRKKVSNEIAILENVCDTIENDDLSYKDLYVIYTLLEGIVDPRINDSIYSNLYKGVYTKQFDEVLSDQHKEKVYNTVLRTKLFINDILTQKKVESNRINYSIQNDFKHMKTCQFIIGCLNNNGFIGKEIDKTFMDVLVKCGITPIEAASIKERININHLKSKHKTVNYDTFNVLNDKIDTIEVSEVDLDEYEEKNANLISSIMSSLNSHGFIESVPILDSVFNNNISIREFDYIMNSLMNNVINTMLDIKGDLANSELYTDNEFRTYMVMEYGNNRTLLRSLKFYSQIKREQLIEKSKLEEEQEKSNANEIPDPINKLIFIDYGNGTHLEKDMKLLPSELYSSIEELLTNLEYGIITKDNNTVFRGTNKRLQYFRELRGDQVRIIYRKLRDNYYEVLGVFQKEDDNDIKNYYNIVSRFSNVDVTDELTRQSDVIRERIRNTIEENKRIGNRYN